MLCRAYLLKEGLRMVFVLGHREGPDAGIDALDTWLGWAARCQIPVFVELGRTTRRTGHTGSQVCQESRKLLQNLKNSLDTR